MSFGLDPGESPISHTIQAATSGKARFGVRDILAGLGVALVLIPQSLAYAELAGLPAHHGLYAAALAPMAAAFFASSPWLQTGPVALTSLLTLGALLPLAAPGSREFVALAGLLALVVGVARIVVGLVRWGWIAFLLSQPVLRGFTAAAALLIIGSQIPAALGVDPPATGVGQRALWTLTAPGSWEPTAVGLTAVTFLLMFGSRRIHPAIPGVLLASLVGLVFSILSGYDGARVGTVPVGLPVISLGLPWTRLPSPDPSGGGHRYGGFRRSGFRVPNLRDPRTEGVGSG